MKRFVFALQLALTLLVSASPLYAWQDAAVATEEKVATEEVVKVELMDAGAAPRHTLRLTPTKGAKESALMVMKMNLKTSIEGQEPPAVPIPAQKFTIEVTVQDVLPSGDILYEFKYTNAEVENDPASPAAVIQAMKAQLAKMEGMSGKATVSNVGMTKGMTLNVPEGLDATSKAMFDSMKDSMNHLSSPLPTEPIGIGGRWKVIQPVTTNGITIVQTSVHELKSVSDSGCKLDITVTQVAEPQDVKAPGLPAGVTLKLDSISTTGSGSSSIDFASVLPSKSEVSIESKAKMHVEAAGLTQNLETLTNMEMTITRPQE